MDIFAHFSTNVYKKNFNHIKGHKSNLTIFLYFFYPFFPRGHFILFLFQIKISTPTSCLISWSNRTEYWLSTSKNQFFILFFLHIKKERCKQKAISLCDSKVHSEIFQKNSWNKVRKSIYAVHTEFLEHIF